MALKAIDVHFEPPPAVHLTIARGVRLSLEFGWQYDDKTPLKHRIERYDPQAQLAFIWVQVPRLTGGVNTDKIFLYYGSKSAKAAGATSPVAAAQPTIGGSAPAAPPMTMFCGVRRFSQIV